MRPILAFTAALACSLPAIAATDPPSVAEMWETDPTRIFDATEIDLAELQWIARPVVVFANSERDPAFEEQMDEILGELDRLVERDVALVVDTDPSDPSELRQRLRPRGFMLVLIGKDGQVKLRKPLPWTVRELSRSIDKMPMRLRELRGGG